MKTLRTKDDWILR